MALGFASIWFGIVVVKMAEICLITPPVGLNCFVADVITIGVLLAFPGIITWPPNLLR